jgi:hypothetical protein
MNRDRLSNFAVGKKFDSIADFFQQSCSDEIERADFGLASLPRLKFVQVPNVDYRKFLFEYIGETALGNSALKRHLAAFEPGRCPSAGARFLSLRTPSGSHPLAGTRAATKAFRILFCSWRRSQFSESHMKISLVLSFEF